MIRRIVRQEFARPEPGDIIGRWRAPWVLGSALGLIYVLAFAWLPSHHPVFWSPDEGGRYLDTREIAQHGRWHNPLDYRGAFLDSELRHVPLQYWLAERGRLYSWWPHFFPAISSVPYRLLGTRGLYVLPLLSSLLISFLVYRLVASRSRGRAMAAMVVSASASPLSFYAFTNWEHTLASCLVLLSATCLVRGVSMSEPRAGLLMLGGALLAASTYLRIETVMFAGAFPLAVLSWWFRAARRRSKELHPAGGQERSLRRAALFTAVYMGCVAPMLLEPWSEQQYLEKHYSVSQRLRSDAHYWQSEVYQALPNWLFGTERHGGLDLGLPLEWMGTGAFFVAFLGAWLRRKPDALVGSSMIVLVGLCAFGLSELSSHISVQGLIIVAPYTALAGFSLGARAEEAGARETWLWGRLAASSLLAFFASSFAAGWEGQGGLQWGPRYALSLYPLLIVSLFRGLPEGLTRPRWPAPGAISRTLLSLAVIGSVLIGFGFQARGLRLMHLIRTQFVAIEQQLAQLPRGAVIVTDSEVLALNLPRLFETRVILRVEPGDAVPPEWAVPSSQAGFDQLCRVSGFAVNQLRTECSSWTSRPDEPDAGAPWRHFD